jgi:hypothetical protein
MSTFEVRDGFTLDLVASEPLVVDPVAMDFDAWGRALSLKCVAIRRDARKAWQDQNAKGFRS